MDPHKKMSSCTHLRIMSGLLCSCIREFVPRMSNVSSNPLNSDYGKSLQNAFGSSRIVDCLFIDHRTRMSLDTVYGILRIDMQNHRQSTQSGFHTHMINTPTTRPCDSSKLRSITSCFGCTNPCRRTHSLASNRKRSKP